MDAQFERGVAPPASPGTISNVLVISKDKRRTFVGLLPTEWAFLVISIVNILTTMGLTIYRLVVVVSTDSSAPSFTFSTLLLINAVFCLVYVFHGLLRERQYELYALVAAIAVVLAFCVVEYIVNVRERSTVKLVRLLVVCLLAPVNIALSIIVANKFGWLEFKIVGASQAFHRMYKEAARFLDMLSFDFQVTVNFVVLVLKNGTVVTIGEVVTLAVGIPLAIIWVMLGWTSLKTELRVGAGFFGGLSLLLPAYVIYKLVEVYTMLTVEATAPEANSMVLIYSLIAAGALALLVRTIVIVELILVYRNFGKGLKERAFSAAADERTSLLAAPRRRR